VAYLRMSVKYSHEGPEEKSVSVRAKSRLPPKNHDAERHITYAVARMSIRKQLTRRPYK